MVNVMFLLNGAKPPRGGEYFTLNFIKKINREVFNPIVVYACRGKIVKEIEKVGIKTIALNLPNELTCIYLRQTAFNNIFFILKFAINLAVSGCVFKVKKIIKKNDIDLVYCADNLSKLMGGLVAKLVKVKVVAHCHDQFKEDSLGKIMRFFYVLLLDKIISVSNIVREFFKDSKKGLAKTVTVYNGIDQDFFDSENGESNLKEELGIDDDCVVIGSIGAIERDKGHIYLLKVLKEINSKNRLKIRCLFCGEGPQELNLKKYVVEQGLQDVVIFLGFRQDIREVLKILDVLVIMSLTIESFSIVAVEAMAMKVPIIATNVGGLPEVVDDGKTGIIVQPGDVNILYEKLQYLINSPNIRRGMGLEGRKRVLQKFTIGDNVKKIEEIFLKVLKVF